MSDESPRPAHAANRDQMLALSFAAAIRTAGYYDPGNAVMQQVCASLWTMISDQNEDEESLRVGVYSHCLFIGSRRVRSNMATYERFGYLMGLYDEWGINTIILHAGASEEDLMGLLVLLGREHGNGPDDFNARLSERGVHNVEAELLTRGKRAQTIAPVAAYAAAVQLGEELRALSDDAKPLDLRRMRRVAQALVDQLVAEPASLLALTTIKEADGCLLSHATNVAILSTLIGQRLGLTKARLGELCLSAFLHDAGKLSVPPDVLQKPGPLEAEEWADIRAHPMAASKALLRGKHVSPASMWAVVVAFEHHMNYDLSGYPTTKVKDHVSLFGNIVALADRYDAVTTPRVYREANFTPHEALHHLLSGAGTWFDPTLVKLFVQIVGLYPPGTVVRLTNGELAVVCEPPGAGTPLDKPKVRFLTGDRFKQVVDLTDQFEGELPLSVVHVVNPANKGQIAALDVTIFEDEA